MIALHVRPFPVALGPTSSLLTALGSRAITDVLAVVGWLRRARCGLGGHSMVRHFEPGRLSLECMSCGEQTPGWTIHAGHA